jgi:acyl-CoA thioester hydrolase
VSQVHTYRCPLRWSDMDAFGHVNNSRYLTYLEEARVDLLLNTVGAHGEAMMRDGVLVAHHSIDYTAPLEFRPEPVLIDVWTQKVGGASFTVAYRVYDPATDERDEIVYATASTRLVAFSLATNSVRRLTEGERAFLTAYLQ